MVQHTATAHIRLPSSANIPSLLTIDQAADVLNVSPTYVRRRLVFEKRIPYLKIGGKVRIEWNAILALIEESRVSATEGSATARKARRTLSDLRREQVARWRISASTP